MTSSILKYLKAWLKVVGIYWEEPAALMHKKSKTTFRQKKVGKPITFNLTKKLLD